MKKLFAVVASLLLASPLMAFETRTLYSSFTTTNDTLQQISSAKTLERVVVSSVTAGGLLTVYDSRGSASRIVAVVTLGVANYYDFEITVSSGLTYSTTANSGGVTIIYTKN